MSDFDFNELLEIKPFNNSGNTSKKKRELKINVYENSPIFSLLQIGERDNPRLYNLQDLCEDSRVKNLRDFSIGENAHVELLNNGNIAVLFSYKDAIAVAFKNGAFKCHCRRLGSSSDNHLRAFVYLITNGYVDVSVTDIRKKYGVENLEYRFGAPITFPRCTMGMINKCLKDNKRHFKVVADGIFDTESNYYFDYSSSLREKLEYCLNKGWITKEQILKENTPERIGCYFRKTTG